MYVSEEQLIETYKSMPSEALASKVISGELTKEAHALALTELKSRKDQFQSPEEAVLEISGIETAKRRSKQLWIIAGLVALVAVLGMIVATNKGYLPQFAGQGRDAVTPLSPPSEPPTMSQLEVIRFDPHTIAPHLGNTDNASPWRVVCVTSGGIELHGLDKFDAQDSQMGVRLARTSDCPLLVFREHFAGNKSISTLPAPASGSIPGITINEALHEHWQKEFTLDSRSFTLHTSEVKDTQGEVIAGSRQLELTVAPGKESVVLGGAPGHIFSELRVIWAGFLTRKTFPAFYIRRTLITGEIDHVLAVAGDDGIYHVGGVTFDPDQPHIEFTSGVDEVEAEEAETDQEKISQSTSGAASTGPPSQSAEPKQPETTRIFATSGQRAVDRLPIYSPPETGTTREKEADAPSLPKVGVIGETQLIFRNATYRVIAEIKATHENQNSSVPSFQSQLPFGSYDGGGHSLVISLQRWNVRQVLLVTSATTEDAVRISAGDFDGSGTLSIELEYAPHYNNSMSYVWRGVNDPGRLVKRISIHQSQGC